MSPTNSSYIKHNCEPYCMYEAVHANCHTLISYMEHRCEPYCSYKVGIYHL